MSPRSVTKTSVTIYEGIHCQHCGKPAPPKATKRFKFCNDTCRQAAYRALTGKSARAGTIRLKAPIPLRAERGLPKDLTWSSHEVGVLQAAFQNRVRGIVEVYHCKFGRGVLDLLRPVADSQNIPGLGCTLHEWARRDGIHVGGFWKLFTTDLYPNHAVWATARCLFRTRKGWQYLPWRDVWMLEYHPRIPGSLRWVHADPTRRIRKNRMVHIDFNRVGVEWDAGKECFTLVRQEKEPSLVQYAMDDLTERDGRQHDDVSAQKIKLDDSNSSDDDGSDGTDKG